MTNKELVLNMQAELSTREISEVKRPETLPEHTDVAVRGGSIASGLSGELINSSSDD
jgi:hypothetical protein